MPCAATSRRGSGIKAIDIYGLSEIIGPGVASECHAAQSGLHVWEDHFLFEVIDPETLAAAARTASRASWSSPRSPRRRCR